MEQSGAGRRINSLSGDLKHDQVVFFKYIKGQSLESNIAAALGLELHHPIMSKLWGIRNQTYRQTDRQVKCLKYYLSTDMFTQKFSPPYPSFGWTVSPNYLATKIM